MSDQEHIDATYAFHAVDEGQRERMDQVRESGKLFAETIVLSYKGTDPEVLEQALHYVNLAMMLTNQAISATEA